MRFRSSSVLAHCHLTGARAKRARLHPRARSKSAHEWHSQLIAVAKHVLSGSYPLNEVSQIMTFWKLFTSNTTHHDSHMTHDYEGIC